MIKVSAHNLLFCLIIGLVVFAQDAVALTPIPTKCILEENSSIASEKRLLIRSQINSAKNDYSQKPDGFREILINNLLSQTDGLCLDIVGYYVYTMLPDIK